jgi:hypothetical protein
MNAESRELSVLLAGRKGISVQIAQINQRVDGRITVVASREEVDDQQLEVAVGARMGTEKEAVILGG